jgi:hypothetical protein
VANWYESLRVALLAALLAHCWLLC